MTKCEICAKKFKANQGLHNHMAMHARRGETKPPIASQAVGVRSEKAPESVNGVLLNGTMTAATHLQTAIRMLREEISSTEKKVVELEIAKSDLAILKARHEALITAQKSMEG
jgi:hypothetical protein